MQLSASPSVARLLSFFLFLDGGLRLRVCYHRVPLGRLNPPAIALGSQLNADDMQQAPIRRRHFRHAMDYSAIAQDPVGSSPWGSPQVDRATFPTPNNNDVPPAPLPIEQPSYDAEAHPGSPRPGQPSGDDEESDSADLSQRLQSAQLGDPDYAVEQPPYSTQQPQDLPHHRGQAPARYHPGARQYSKQSHPVYKIQAKITGLERTGKKDLILRFDVHVRTCFTKVAI